MKPAWFHPNALVEADKAAEFYREYQEKLEIRFLEALNETIQRIRRNPDMYRLVEGDIRKCRLMRFPFAVIYRNTETRIEVIAVMHFRRKLGYWKSRT